MTDRELQTIREMANWEIMRQDRDLAWPERAIRLLDEIDQLKVLMTDTTPEATDHPKVIPWAYAGGPNECEHGYAAGIPCPHCLSIPLPVPSPAPPATLRVTDELAEGMRIRMREVGVQDLLADRAEMVKELARHDKILRAYSGLLAIIFRDGGHRRCEIGDDVAAGEAAREVVLAERSELARLRDEVEALAKFKSYVHRRLDEAGVPADPDSPHKAEGCRIGGRLDMVLSKYQPEETEIE